jgi:hypothetical protein
MAIERQARQHLQLRSRSDLRSLRIAQATVLPDKRNVFGEHG